MGEHRDVYTECQNNTMGDLCDKCNPLYVGKPTNGGSCTSCLDQCNQHSRICMSREEEQLRASEAPGLPLDVNNITLWLKSGPTEASNTICVNCGDNTEGALCNECKRGYFRLKGRPLSEPCLKCNCSGHGDTCDKEKGDGCDCKNNTKSQRCDNSDSANTCYQNQCTTCNDQFHGIPTNGHQCYRQMSVEREQCFDPSTQMSCNELNEPATPLNIHQTVFFAVPPKYQNVNIRIVIDVTKGGIDLYFSPSHNTYRVLFDPTTLTNKVSIDPIYKYRRVSAQSEDQVRSNRGRRSLDQPVYRRRDVGQYDLFTDALYRSSTAPSVVRSGGGSASNHTTTTTEIVEKIYRLEEIYSPSDNLVTFVSVDHADTFLIVRNVTNRLVVMLQHSVHDLQHARFYLVLAGVGSAASDQTWGILYFRQDTPHIDLFVFFSVFFSCFFLFLAVCVVLWKIKQVLDSQRSRIQRRLELQSMASRPFSRAIVYFDTAASCTTGSASRASAGMIQRWGGGRGGGGERRRSSRAGQVSGGGHRNSTVGGVDGTLFAVNPLAMEPTSDSLAVVSTFFFQLPGGSAVPVKACLGTALVNPRVMCAIPHHVATPAKPNVPPRRGGPRRGPRSGSRTRGEARVV